MGNSIHSPISGMQEPIFPSEYLKLLHRSVRAIPTCIHPEILKSNSFPRDLIDEAETCGCLHPAPYGKGNRQNDWLPVILGGVISQDVPPENIVSIHIVSVPR